MVTMMVALKAVVVAVTVGWFFGVCSHAVILALLATVAHSRLPVVAPNSHVRTSVGP